MTNAIVRRATLADYEGVLDIGIMYGGYDYLPYFYDKFLADPDYTSYVCEVEGEIVGYQAVLVHDEGRSVQARACRVKPDHRGKGYLKQLTEALVKDTHNLPMLDRKLSVRASKTIDWETLSHTLKLVLSTKSAQFTMHLPDKSRLHFSGVTPMHEGNIRALLENRIACDYLFPCDLIHIHYLVLGLFSSNIKYIVNDNTKVFATLANTPHSTAKPVSPEQVSLPASKVVSPEQASLPPAKSVSPEQASSPTAKSVSPEQVSLLTVGLNHPTRMFHRYSINVFGNNFESLHEHVKAHLSGLDQSIEKVNLAICYREELPDDVGENIYKTYGDETLCNFRFIHFSTFSEIFGRSMV